MFIRSIILLLFVTIVVSTSALEESNVNPSINQNYSDPDYEVWVNRFERAGREVYDYRNEIVGDLKLSPDSYIADIGAGTGLFSRLFAKAVPQGHVYAVDVSKTFVENIVRTAKEQNLSNLTGVVNSQKSVNLPANSVDVVFLCDTYHHFEFPKTTLADIRQALKKQGRMVIIDFRKDPKVSSTWVMNHTRLNKKQLIQEVTQANFKLLRENDLLSENYFLEFVKN